MNVCVYGASSASLADIYYMEAETLGRLLAQRGHRLVFGGGKHGLMGSVALGAWQERGEILGIAPKFFDEPDVLFEHCTDFLYTTTMRERKQLMEDRSEAVIVLPGGIGTLDEFFETLVLKSFEQQPKPIIFYNINGYYDRLKEMMEFGIEENFIASRVAKLYRFFDSAEELIIYLEIYKKLEKEE